MPSSISDQQTFGQPADPNTNRIPGKIYKVHRTGLATYDVRYQGVLREGASLTFKQGDTPISGEYPDVVLMEISIIGDNTVCGGVIIDLHYEGKADARYTKDAATDDLSLEFVSSQEDIFAHPDFKKFGGTPAAPLHGAKFDPQTGRFQFFDIVDPDHPDDSYNPYAGTSSYLLPTPVLHLNKIETSWPDTMEFKSVGKVDDPGNYTSNAPTLPASQGGGEREWLYASIIIQNIANTYFPTKRQFQGSGPRPINKGIYYDPPLFDWHGGS